jgi:hypothetical protein
MATGHHQLELIVTGLAENGDALGRAPRSLVRVVLKLLVDLLDPFGLEQPLVDRPADFLLILRVVVAADLGAGDLPVVGDARPQQTPLGIVKVPIERHVLLLGVAQRIVKSLHERLRRFLSGSSGHRGNCGDSRGGPGDLQKVAAVQLKAFALTDGT